MSVFEVETNPVDFDDWVALQALLQSAFAYMEGRIDPPSSLATLDPPALARKAALEDLFLIRQDSLPIACAFAVAQGKTYYVGKLAAAAQHRQSGMGRAVMQAVLEQARDLGLSVVELQSRVELTDLHGFFRHMGFAEVGATAHPGYDRPTSLTFRLVLG